MYYKICILCIYMIIYNIYITLYILTLYITLYNLFIEHSGEHWWEQNIFCSFTTPQAFWQSSALGALSTVVTSVVLYSLTRATLMSRGKDETRVCGYILYIYYIYIYIFIYIKIYIYIYIHVYICIYVWIYNIHYE